MAGNGTDNCAANASDMVVLNQKLQYDGSAQLQHQSLVDNQEDARAWSTLKLRRAENAATTDHFLNITAAQATATAMQVGQSEDEQTTSPVRTATGDAIVGGVGVSAEQIAANVANIATALTPVIATAITSAIMSLIPVIVTASGGASTPSQTQPKSAS